MFVLLTTSGLYYNGKAGPAWVSADKAEAWRYGSRPYAEEVAARFNSRTALHGLTFKVEEA